MAIANENVALEAYDTFLVSRYQQSKAPLKRNDVIFVGERLVDSRARKLAAESVER